MISFRSGSWCGVRSMEGEGNERRFELSFSSEEPYGRWFGSEILDHTEGCMDLERLNSIGVLLFNHDTDRVLGKVERAWNRTTGAWPWWSLTTMRRRKQSGRRWLGEL